MKHFFISTLLIFPGGILNGHVGILSKETNVIQSQNITVKCFHSVSVEKNIDSAIYFTIIIPVSMCITAVNT